MAQEETCFAERVKSIFSERKIIYMKPISKWHRVISFLVVMCIMCALTIPVSAIVVSPDFAPVNTVLYSTTIENATDGVMHLLNAHHVEYNEETLITVETSASGGSSSILHITTQNGEIITDTVFVGYDEGDSGDFVHSNFAADLISPNNSGTGQIKFANVLVKGETIYTRTTNGSRIYVRPTGQKITCYDYGGTLPSSIKVNTQIQGNLCNSSFTVTNNNYAYNHPFNKSSPSFGTTYTQNGSAIASTQWISPGSDVSYVLRLQAVINGTTYSDTVNIFSWLA